MERKILYGGKLKNVIEIHVFFFGGVISMEKLFVIQQQNSTIYVNGNATTFFLMLYNVSSIIRYIINLFINGENVGT